MKNKPKLRQDDYTRITRQNMALAFIFAFPVQLLCYPNGPDISGHALVTAIFAVFMVVLMGSEVGKLVVDDAAEAAAQLESRVLAADRQGYERANFEASQASSTATNQTLPDPRAKTLAEIMADPSISPARKAAFEEADRLSNMVDGLK